MANNTDHVLIKYERIVLKKVMRNFNGKMPSYKEKQVLLQLEHKGLVERYLFSATREIWSVTEYGDNVLRRFDERQKERRIEIGNSWIVGLLSGAMTLVPVIIDNFLT